MFDAKEVPEVTTLKLAKDGCQVIEVLDDLQRPTIIPGDFKPIFNESVYDMNLVEDGEKSVASCARFQQKITDRSFLAMLEDRVYPHVAHYASKAADVAVKATSPVVLVRVSKCARQAWHRDMRDNTCFVVRCVLVLSPPPPPYSTRATCEARPITFVYWVVSHSVDAYTEYACCL